MALTQRNIIFISFENFHVKAFHFKTILVPKSDVFLFQEMHTIAIPELLKRDKATREAIVNDIFTQFIRYFQLHMQDVFFYVTASEKDFIDIGIQYPSKIVLSEKKDRLLLPYFISSYLDVLHVITIHLAYFTVEVFDNNGLEVQKNWDNWRSLARLLIDTPPLVDHTLMNNLFNNFIRPVIHEANSFPLAMIASLELMRTKHEITSKDEVIIIMTGEVLGWMTSPEDVFFPILTGMGEVPSFITVYHDSANVLEISKVLKECGLKLLENTMIQFVHNIGSMLTIKTKKKAKSTDLIGKLSIVDEEGERSIYPIVDDIMCIPLKGNASITMDIHFPFYVDNGKKTWKVKDLLVIDTRQHDKQNILNFSSWHDRMKKQ